MHARPLDGCGGSGAGPRCLHKYIFIGHDKTSEAVEFVLQPQPPAAPQIPRTCRLLPAENHQRMGPVVMETGGATIYKNEQ